MKNINNRKIKLLFSLIIISCIYILCNNSYGYEITNIVRTKEDLYGDNAPGGFPEMIYKKQIAPYGTTTASYNALYEAGKTKDGWVYATADSNDAGVVKNPETYEHTSSTSYVRVYEYFHKYQNSVYNKTDSSGNTAKYYATGQLWPHTYVIGVDMIPKVVYNITEETKEYSGIYWQRAYQGFTTGLIGEGKKLDLKTITNRKDNPVVLMKSNLYRYAVTNSKNTNGVGAQNIYISDNAMDSATVGELWNKFGENNTSKELKVYCSSVIRTSKNVGKYYDHMDTTFKFWETVMRGNVSSLWAEAPDIKGNPSSASVLNFYDNVFVFPKGVNTKKIYVRHIDVTGLSQIKSNLITDSMVIDNIDNGQLIEAESAEVNGKLKFVNYKFPTSRNQSVEKGTNSFQKYNEMYEVDASDKQWIIGNIKYENSTSYVEEKNGNTISKTVAYLNSNSDAVNTEREKDILNNYNCVGRSIGYGDSIEEAIKDRDKNLDDTPNLSSLGGDYSNQRIYSSNEKNYIVIDFYYEKKPTEIYVRHINVNDIKNISDTNITNSYNKNNSIFIQTGKGKAINVPNSNWNSMIDYIDAKRPKTSNETLKYQEYYTKESKKVFRIANIKYDNSTAGSYWGLLSSSQQKEYEKYYCIGAAIGKGSSFEVASENKDLVKKEQLGDTCSTVEFAKLTSTEAINKEDRSIIRNDDYTSTIISNNNYNVVVVDFYYAKEKTSSNNNDTKDVYVRYLDMTGQNINYNNVQNAVASGKLLTGKGWGWEMTSEYTTGKSKTAKSIYQEGYKEKYSIQPSSDFRIETDISDDYICQGYNITGSNTNFKDAKRYMDNGRLSKGLYTKISGKDVTTNLDSTVILIDIYYTSRHTGKALDRPSKGRLSFYTLSSLDDYKKVSGKNSTQSNVNNPVAKDNDDVIDIIPSGESLRMSIDNAYTYMLGAINIKEQKIKDTYSFTYLITQKYLIKYLDWYGVCPEHGAEYGDGRKRVPDVTNVNKTKKCEAIIGYDKECDSNGENCKEKPIRCRKELYYEYEAAEKEIEIVRRYQYQIPYEYTFYKVKNMRIYTISKVELLDDYSYSNVGLPLFDGKTHIIAPKKAYTDSFNSSNTKFYSSSDERKVNRTKKTLDGTLVYCYNNEKGDINVDTDEGFMAIRRRGISDIDALFDNVTHSMAAELDGFIVSESKDTEIYKADGEEYPISYTYKDVKSVNNDERLRVTLKIKNDEILFKDGITNKDVVIVGEGDYTWASDPDDANCNSSKKYKDGSSEKNAIKFVDLVEFTKNVERKGDGYSPGTAYKYDVEDTDLQVVSTQYPKSIRGTTDTAKGSKYLPTANLTNKDYFEEVELKIPSTRLNGKRYSYGKIYYTLLENKNNDLNFDAKDNGSKTCKDDNKGECHDWNSKTNRIAAVGGGNSTFVDTEMYNQAGSSSPTKTTLITPTTLGQVTMSFGDKKNSTDNKADVVDVFTPISFRTWLVTGQADVSNKQVNHTIDENKTEFQIQKNSRFTIAMEPTSKNLEYEGVSTDKYIGRYYIKFDFDVQDVKIYDSGDRSGRNYDAGVISAGTWIGPIYHNTGKGEAKVSVFALADPNSANENNVVNQETNSYTVRAVAYNAPEALLYALSRDKVMESLISKQLYNEFKLNAGKTHQQYYEQKNIEDHNNYVAETTVQTQNLSRVYDFKVTDLKDLDWKDIFRKTTSTTTNVHTSKAYYSGIKKWNVYTTKSNERLVRDSSEIGSTKQQILPLGPYKHTNGTYTDAPKLGYKFSFDLKTTGSLVNKKVIITPEFYYVSKELNGNRPVTIEKNIDLYYKNSSNKYVSIDNYNLYFVPDDGYRLTFEGTDAAYRFSNSSLSKSTVKLGNTRKLTLTTKMMEEADKMFVQIWYGEYKLPNSTIAVKAGDNINNKLTNGYIGVKFNIQVEEYNASGVKTRVLDYAKNDSNSLLTNTSQWDYEGYLGYNGDGEVIGVTNSKGENVTARIALKGGSWILTQEDYKFVKGTVILYDTDAKASSDYN